MFLLLIWLVIGFCHFFRWSLNSFVENSFLWVSLLALVRKFSFDWILWQQTGHITIVGDKIFSKGFFFIHHPARLEKVKLKPLIQIYEIIMVQ